MEKLGPETPLLQFDTRGNKTNPFLRTALVTRDIREAIRGSGFNCRPYVLRSYCDTALDIAESKGIISHPWRMFFMGHKGDIEARYSTNKTHLPPAMVEEMREAYRKASNLMQTISADSPSEDQMKKAGEGAIPFSGWIQQRRSREHELGRDERCGASKQS
jgi:hypothetical protein